MPAPRAKRAAEDDAAADDLKLDQLPTLFSASQHSIATHRKNINTLHAIFLRCASVTALSSDGKSIRLTGEKSFGEAFRNAVVYPLGVKKGVEQGDRVIKFIAGFVGFAVEHGAFSRCQDCGWEVLKGVRADAKLREKKEAAGEEEDEDDDGPASRLVSQLLAFLLKGFQAKNKIARFRCVQLVALMVNSLGEIECVPSPPVVVCSGRPPPDCSDDSYRHLKGALLERVRDKESTVRMQAVVALSKLQSADDDEESDDDDDEGEATRVSEVLIDVLTHDSAAFVPPLLPSPSQLTPRQPNSEVRRAALFNLLPSPSTLPALLLRTLDVDPINRRAAFTHVLHEIPCQHLSQEQREQAIGRGLRDREEGVKKAAKRLVGKWAEEAGGLVEVSFALGEKGCGELMRCCRAQFVQMFDVFEGEVAEKVVLALYETKPELVDALDLGGSPRCSATPFQH